MFSKSYKVTVKSLAAHIPPLIPLQGSYANMSRTNTCDTNTQVLTKAPEKPTAQERIAKAVSVASNVML